MIWFTARMALSSAYLLLEPQPPNEQPTISSADTARKKSTPMLRSAHARPARTESWRRRGARHQERQRRQVVDSDRRPGGW